MKFEDIWQVVVDGGKVTCDRIGPGVYVDYAFNGLRINHPHGASSGFRGTEEDRAAEWREVTDEIELPGVTTREQAARLAKHDNDVLVLDGGKWGKPKPAPAPANVGKWGKPLPSPGKWGKGS